MNRIITRNINPRPQKRTKNMGFSSLNFNRKSAIRNYGKGAVPKGYAKGSRITMGSGRA
ncbi:MAG: hypothetical protein KA120_06820 [Candidatus Goldbacteria bacterium]|nr:hypothetical protein [Candidatus Goldiibacteriota bacterium]